jgi:5-methylthioadenosine/S-adenosylhomocysteine deaminase
MCIDRRETKLVTRNPVTRNSQPGNPQYDIVIHNGIVVTMNPDFDVLEKGFVGIRNGVIRKVASQEDGVPLPEARQGIDACGGIIMPGLVNTHTHAPMSLFRGLADDVPLMQWLNEYIFPAESPCCITSVLCRDDLVWYDLSL